eukprot:scaffold35757_cov52-Phaeocystis_antarctica.AAC.8
MSQAARSRQACPEEAQEPSAALSRGRFERTALRPSPNPNPNPSPNPNPNPNPNANPRPTSGHFERAALRPSPRSCPMCLRLQP